MFCEFMDKERLEKLIKRFDFLSVGEGSLPRELPEESVSDFVEIKAGIHYDKEEDDFYGKLLKEKQGKVIKDLEKEGGVMWYGKDGKTPEVDKNYGSDVNAIGSSLEECLKSGKTNAECGELQKRLERAGKWDGELTGKISSDFTGLSKKAKQDLLRVRESAERIKNLEDFGYALRSLKNEIVGKKYLDFVEHKIDADQLVDSLNGYDLDYEE